MHAFGEFSIFARSVNCRVAKQLNKKSTYLLCRHRAVSCHSLLFGDKNLGMIKSTILLCLCLLLTPLASGEFSLERNLATKSLYYPQQDATSYAAVPAGCTLVHQEYLARHGSREPTLGDVKKLQTLKSTLVEHADDIGAPQYQWMKSWVDPFADNIAGELLVPDGADEHYFTAKRMLENYASLLNVSYDPNVFVMRSTHVSRAGRSGNAFAYALLEGRGSVPSGSGDYMPFYLYSESLDQDVELRFFDNCPRYRDVVLDNPATLLERELWIEQRYPPIAQRVSAELGGDAFSPPRWNVSTATLAEMWLACTFEVVVSNRTDQFCSLFSADDALTFDYAVDLKTYYTSAYGHDLDWQQSAALLQSIVGGLEARVSNTSGAPLAQLRFAHAETIMPFAAMLGMFRDAEPLRANATDEQRQNRQWKTSTISPFAANDNFLLYECPAELDDGRFRVKYLHNEKEYTLPGCSSFFCDFAEFRQLFASKLAIDFDELCDVPECVTTPIDGGSSSDSDHHDDDDDNGSKLALALYITVPVMLVIIALLVGYIVRLRSALPSRSRSEYDPLVSSP
jgi:multiple inositol-polyphosphate phosphatase / 2,3-bisphosphoglycerate 3-phosphatase